MKMRGTALMAIVLAFAATLGLFLYVKGVREEAGAGGGAQQVIVSKQDIPVGTRFDPLVTQGVFTTKPFPKNSLVQGVVTDLNQLRGQSAAFPILAGEQISTLRFQGSAQVAGGMLGIKKGYTAVTLQIEAPRAVGGVVQRGDHVTMYSTFENVSIIGGTLKQLLAGQPLPKQDIGDFTAIVVPDVRVLRVLGTGPYQMTLELKPSDAQKVIYSAEKGANWFALLPPGEKGESHTPITIIDVLRTKGPQPL